MGLTMIASVQDFPPHIVGSDCVAEHPQKRESSRVKHAAAARTAGRRTLGVPPPLLSTKVCLPPSHPLGA